MRSISVITFTIIATRLNVLMLRYNKIYHIYLIYAFMRTWSISFTFIDVNTFFVRVNFISRNTVTNIGPQSIMTVIGFKCNSSQSKDQTEKKSREDTWVWPDDFWKLILKPTNMHLYRMVSIYIHQYYCIDQNHYLRSELLDQTLRLILMTGRSGPIKRNPKPSKPSLQIQRKDPGVFWHVASGLKVLN